MARLSIVIPAAGDQVALDDSLLSVLENRPTDTQVIVPHRRGYRDPYALDDEVEFVEAAGRGGLTDLLRAGCQAARGAWIHWLVPGVAATSGWTDWLATQRSSSRLTVVAPLLAGPPRPGDSEADRTIHALGVNYRVGGQREFPGRGCPLNSPPLDVLLLGPSLWTGFIRRDLLHDVGPWNESLAIELADIDLGLRLAERGHACLVQSESVLVLQSRAMDRWVEPRWGFRVAWRSERFYRAQSATYRQATRHLSHVLRSALARAPHPAVLTGLLGSYVGRFGRPADASRPGTLKLHHPGSQSHEVAQCDEPSAGQGPAKLRREAA